MRMHVHSLALACALLPLPAIAAPAPTLPSYAPDGRLQLPPTYREWIFLSSGIDMTYGPAPATPGAHSRFENVFVDPDAYRGFLATGIWPDHTVLVLEIRSAETEASINRSGKTQGADINGIEVHVKDTAHGGWTFFDVDRPTGLGKLILQTASCYTCHEAHAAADTTFAQFYPTLLPVARSKSTLSPAYLKEIATDPARLPAPSATPASNPASNHGPASRP